MAGETAVNKQPRNSGGMKWAPRKLLYTDSCGDCQCPLCLSQRALETVALKLRLKGRVEFDQQRMRVVHPRLRARGGAGGQEGMFPMCFGVASIHLSWNGGFVHFLCFLSAEPFGLATYLGTPLCVCICVYWWKPQYMKLIHGL